MLKAKALKKIFVTTLTMFIILTIYTIPTTYNSNKNILRTNLEIEDITDLSTDKVYLLDNDNLLVKVDIFIDSKKFEDKIEKIIDYLTIDNNKIPVGLSGYIPKNTKILDYNLNNKNLIINFSKEFLNYKKENEKIIITGLVYSMIELGNVSSVNITVDGQYLEGYTGSLNKNIGINNKYLFHSRNNISKVVVYYLDNISDNIYYVPVTNYLNDDREKIEIIIDELTSNNVDNSDLISLVNNNIKLINYKEEGNVLFLNFNDYLLDKDDDVSSKIINTIAYSVFDNYDVNMVMFEVNNKEVKYIKRE